MLNGRFKKLYLRLWGDLDNILSDKCGLSLCEDYGLGSDQEIVDYLASKLSDAAAAASAAKYAIHIGSLHLPQKHAAYSLFYWVEASAAIARRDLFYMLSAIDSVNREENLRLRIFEHDRVVCDFLGDLYKVLLELVSFLHLRRIDEAKRIVELYPTSETAVSSLAHSIAILQSASACKIARDIRDEVAARLLRENVLEVDEGFEEHPTIKQADDAERALVRLLRDCVNSTAVMSARRSAYVLACCVISCAPIYLKNQMEDEHHLAEIHAVTESLLTVCMLIVEHVPTEFRAMVAGIVADESFAAKYRLLDMINLGTSYNPYNVAVGTEEGYPDAQLPSCGLLSHSSSPCNSIFAALKSVGVVACDTLFDAAYTYEAYAAGDSLSALRWNVRKPVQNSFVIFNLTEAMFITHHVLHMVELNLQEAQENMRYIQNLHGVWKMCSLMMHAVAIASSDTVDLVRKAEGYLDGAFSMLCHVGGEDFIEKFLRISESRSRKLSNIGVHICLLYEVAQCIRSACFDLQKVEKEYAYKLKTRNSERIIQCIHRVYLLCIRVSDVLFRQDFHDYAWNVNCRSALPVLPGELPEKVTTCELPCGVKSVRFSDAVLEEALNPTIFEGLPIYKEKEEIKGGGGGRGRLSPGSLLAPIPGVIRCVKECFTHPSSSLSRVSLANLSQSIQERALRTPFLGTFITDLCCSKVYEAECRSLPFTDYRGQI